MDPIATFNSPYALLAILAIAVATRALNAYLTDESAPDWVTAGISVVLAGLGALMAYATDTTGVKSWQGALAVFVSAIVAAKGITAVDPGIEPRLKAGGLNIGVNQSGVDTYPRVPAGPAADVEQPADGGGFPPPQQPETGPTEGPPAETPRTPPPRG